MKKLMVDPPQFGTRSRHYGPKRYVRRDASAKSQIAKVLADALCYGIIRSVRGSTLSGRPDSLARDWDSLVVAAQEATAHFKRSGLFLLLALTVRTPMPLAQILRVRPFDLFSHPNPRWTGVLRRRSDGSTLSTCAVLPSEVLSHARAIGGGAAFPDPLFQGRSSRLRAAASFVSAARAIKKHLKRFKHGR